MMRIILLSVILLHPTGIWAQFHGLLLQEMFATQYERDCLKRVKVICESNHNPSTLSSSDLNFIQTMSCRIAPDDSDNYEPFLIGPLTDSELRQAHLIAKKNSCEEDTCRLDICQGGPKAYFEKRLQQNNNLRESLLKKSVLNFDQLMKDLAFRGAWLHNQEGSKLCHGELDGILGGSETTPCSASAKANISAAMKKLPFNPFGANGAGGTFEKKINGESPVKGFSDLHGFYQKYHDGIKEGQVSFPPEALRKLIPSSLLDANGKPLVEEIISQVSSEENASVESLDYKQVMEQISDRLVASGRTYFEKFSAIRDTRSLNRGFSSACRGRQRTLTSRVTGVVEAATEAMQDPSILGVGYSPEERERLKVAREELNEVIQALPIRDRECLTGAVGSPNHAVNILANILSANEVTDVNQTRKEQYLGAADFLDNIHLNGENESPAIRQLKLLSELHPSTRGIFLRQDPNAPVNPTAKKKALSNMLKLLNDMLQAHEQYEKFPEEHKNAWIKNFYRNFGKGHLIEDCQRAKASLQKMCEIASPEFNAVAFLEDSLNSPVEAAQLASLQKNFEVLDAKENLTGKQSLSYKFGHTLNEIMCQGLADQLLIKDVDSERESEDALFTLFGLPYEPSKMQEDLISIDSSASKVEQGITLTHEAVERATEDSDLAEIKRLQKQVYDHPQNGNSYGDFIDRHQDDMYITTTNEDGSRSRQSFRDYFQDRGLSASGGNSFSYNPDSALPEYRPPGFVPRQVTQRSPQTQTSTQTRSQTTSFAPPSPPTSEQSRGRYGQLYRNYTEAQTEVDDISQALDQLTQNTPENQAAKKQVGDEKWQKVISDLQSQLRESQSKVANLERQLQAEKNKPTSTIQTPTQSEERTPSSTVRGSSIPKTEESIRPPTAAAVVSESSAPSTQRSGSERNTREQENDSSSITYFNASNDGVYDLTPRNQQTLYLRGVVAKNDFERISEEELLLQFPERFIPVEEGNEIVLYQYIGGEFKVVSRENKGLVNENFFVRSYSPLQLSSSQRRSPASLQPERKKTNLLLRINQTLDGFETPTPKPQQLKKRRDILSAFHSSLDSIK